METEPFSPDRKDAPVTTMRALVSEHPGPPATLVLRQMPEPIAGPGQVRIAVEACGINYPDALMIEDRYQFTFKRPFAPGIEICGRVEAIGQGVAGIEPGMRVLAQISNGGLAELAVVDADRLFRVGEHIAPEQAASALLTYGTSHYALTDRGKLRPGETLLVLGAGGGVGLAAVELGKSMGAHVVAAVSSPQKASAARAAGADSVIMYDRDVDPSRLAAQFKAACPKGADLIYDPVGGAYAEPALRAIGWNGRYLVIGFAGGIPRIPLNLALLKSAQILGVFWGAAIARNPAAMQAKVQTVIDWFASGKLRPAAPTVYPLERAGEAIAALSSRSAVGKLVVTIATAPDQDLKLLRAAQRPMSHLSKESSHDA